MEAKKITSVYEYLIDYLRKEIITGGFAPGEKASEYHLAEKLHVSRPMLREVLRTLEGEGLVCSIPRRGSFIATTSYEDFRELYEIREMIECKALDLLQKRNIRSIPGVEKAIENETGVYVPSSEASRAELLRFFEVGFMFHSLLINAAGNKRLSQYYEGLQHNLLRYHVLLGSENLHASRIDHSELVRLLGEGRFDKARDYLTEHIRDHADIIRKEFKKWS